MVLKASYAVFSLASVGLLLFAAPSGALFTSKPERGKVERRVDPAASNGTVRRPHFVFIGGGYQGGK
jgi:hypothetical protein